MALPSSVPSSVICRRASCATLAAVMPVGLRLALVLCTLPPNMDQSCGGKLWAPAATVTLAPSSREITTVYFILKASHQSAQEGGQPARTSSGHFCGAKVHRTMRWRRPCKLMAAFNLLSPGVVALSVGDFALPTIHVCSPYRGGCVSGCVRYPG